jgi:hypothetical protein
MNQPKTKEQIRKFIRDHYDYTYGINTNQYTKESMQMIFKMWQEKAESGNMKTIGAIERFAR